MAEYDRETGEIVSSLYRRSAELNDLFAALAKAQAEFDAAEKAGKGNFGKHATLESVLEATSEGRKNNNLAIIQLPGNGDGNNVAVTTILGHSSGQWIESTFSVAPNKFDAQGAGSVVTYLRRYALMSVLGVAPEDDDGDAAVSAPQRGAAQEGATRRAQPKQPAAPAAQATATNGARPKWIVDFLARSDYEIDPNKAGGWSAWEKAFLTIAEHAENIDQLMKLTSDNTSQTDDDDIESGHMVEFKRAVRPEVAEDFNQRLAAAVRRLDGSPKVPA